MSYGLFDCDFLNQKYPILNLELMKLSTFYKRKGEIVAYSSTFKPERYNNFIIGKDRLGENFNYPILNYNNIQLVGRFFSPKKYTPLDIEIEKQKPDTSLYEKVFKDHANTIDSTFASAQLRGEHIRLSLDGTTLWDNFDKQFKNDYRTSIINIYDYNITQIENVNEVLNYITTRNKTKNPQRLSIKFPVRLNSVFELQKWQTYDYAHHQVNFLIDHPLTQEEVDYLVQNKQFLMHKKITLDISKNTTYEEFINGGINVLFRQISILRTLPFRMALIYDKEFFKDERWERVTHLIKKYLETHYKRTRDKTKRQYYTLFAYAKGINFRKVFHYKKEELNVRELFYFVQQENYSLFKDFYELLSKEK